MAASPRLRTFSIISSTVARTLRSACCRSSRLRPGLRVVIIVKFGIAAFDFRSWGDRMQLLLAGDHSAERWIQPNQNCIHFKLVWVAIWWIDSFHLIGIVRRLRNSG